MEQKSNKPTNRKPTSDMATSMLQSSVVSGQDFHGSRDIITHARQLIKSENDQIHNSVIRSAYSPRHRQNDLQNDTRCRDKPRPAISSETSETNLLQKLYSRPTQQVLGALTQFLNEDYLIRVLNEEDSDDALSPDAGGQALVNNQASDTLKNKNDKSSYNYPIGSPGFNYKTNTSCAPVYKDRKRKREEVKVKREVMSPHSTTLLESQDMLTRMYIDHVKTELPEDYNMHRENKLIPLHDIGTYRQKSHDIPVSSIPVSSNVQHYPSRAPRHIRGSYNIAAILGPDESRPYSEVPSVDTPLDLSVKNNHSYHVASLQSVLSHIAMPLAVHPGVIRPTPITAKNTANQKLSPDDLSRHDHTNPAIPEVDTSQSNKSTGCNITEDVPESSPSQSVPAANHSISMSISEQKALQRKIASIVPKKRPRIVAETCNSKPLKKRIVGNLSSPDMLSTKMEAGNESFSFGSDLGNDKSYFSRSPPKSMSPQHTHSSPMSKCTNDDIRHTTPTTSHSKKHTMGTDRRERSATPEDVNLQEFASDVIDRVYSDSGSSNECSSPILSQQPGHNNNCSSTTTPPADPADVTSGTSSPTSITVEQSQDLSSRSVRKQKSHHSRKRKTKAESNTNQPIAVPGDKKMFSLTDIITNMIEVEYSHSDDSKTSASPTTLQYQDMSSSDDETHRFEPPPRTRSLPQQLGHSETDSDLEAQYSDQDVKIFGKCRRGYAAMTTKILSDNDVAFLRKEKMRENVSPCSSNESDVFSEEDSDEHVVPDNHLKRWETEEELKCGTIYVCRNGNCMKAFSKYKYLASHRYAYHQCGDCKKQFSIRPSLMAHMKFHNRGRFLCELCGVSFHFNLTYQKHKSAHSKETPYACELCGMSYNTPAKLALHKTHEEKEAKFTCSICSKSFCLRKELAQHMNSKHRCLRFKCWKCSSTYQELYQLKRHEQHKHGFTTIYSCEHCQQHYTSLSLYTKCLLSHRGDIKGQGHYECDQLRAATHSHEWT